MSVYLDASILVALLQDEAGSDAAVRYVTDISTPMIVSDFARGEVTSAISRRFRTGEIELDKARELLGAMDEWIATAAEAIPTEASDIRLADQFVRRLLLGVRMPDAIHLAAAQARDLTVVTFDKHMAMVAEQLRIDVVTPG